MRGLAERNCHTVLTRLAQSPAGTAQANDQASRFANETGAPTDSPFESSRSCWAAGRVSNKRMPRATIVSTHFGVRSYATR